MENMENFKLSDLFSKVGEIKKNMEEAQKRISRIRVNASSGAGMVTVTVSGDNQIVDIKINKDLFESEDLKMLEDLVISAVNEGLKKAKDAMAHEYKNVTGGMVNPMDMFRNLES